MDALLLLTGLLLLLVAGGGLALLVAPRYATLNLAEFLGLSILYGTGVVSLASFGLGLLVPGATARALASAVCLLLGGAGLAASRTRAIRVLWAFPSLTRLERILAGVVVAETVLVGWLVFNTVLDSDGLFIWEFKARLAQDAGGMIPLAYFADRGRVNSHPEYPPLLPLTEAWIYGWFGRPDQDVVKIALMLFHLAGVAMLFAGARRLGATRGRALLAPALLLFVPKLVLGRGSAASGFADLPLAVCYLATTVYLLDHLRTGSLAPLRFATPLATLLPWIKQEGIVLLLAAALMVLAARSTRVLAVFGPGVLLYGLWQIFLASVDAPRLGDFLPITIQTLASNLGRLFEVALWLPRQLVTLQAWSMLWVAFPLALLQRSPATEGRLRAGLAVAVVLPVLFYSGTFVFSAYVPFMHHVDIALPRLILHPALVAVLTVALFIPLPAGFGWLRAQVLPRGLATTAAS